MAELADARDLKSRDTKVSYGFDSRFRHHIAEWSSLVARRAHNPKVVGSNPASATKKEQQSVGLLFFFASECDVCAHDLRGYESAREARTGE